MIYGNMTVDDGYYAAELETSGFGDADDLAGLFSFVRKAAKTVGRTVGRAVAPVLRTVPGGSQALALAKAAAGGGQNAADRRHRDELFQRAARGDQDALARLKRDATSGRGAANRKYSAALLQRLGNRGLSTYQAPGNVPILLQPGGGATGATGPTTFPTTPSDAGTPGFPGPGDAAAEGGNLAGWFLPVAILGGLGVVAFASGKSRGGRTWK